MALVASQAATQPGTLIQNVNLPVPGRGVSIAVDCVGNVYYTLEDFNLYVMDSFGALLNTVPIADAAGTPLLIDEMAWDESRQILWGQLHGSNPVDVYQINAATGMATFAFTSQTISVGIFRDGIAYDGTDDSLWLSGDVSTTIEHYQTNGTFINAITPTDAAGNTLGLISGVMVGVGDLLYVGRNGAVQIVQVKKSDGTFIASFASPGGARDEGLECDPVNFLPVLALWSREFNAPGFASVIEIAPETCECGGGAVLTCTKGFWKNHPEDWVNLLPGDVPAWGGGATYLEILHMAPKKGDASILLAHAFIAATLNSGAPAGDLAAAEALLMTYPVGSGALQAKGKNTNPDRAVALALAGLLQEFNESAECTL
jgi:hypothetical protein